MALVYKVYIYMYYIIIIPMVLVYKVYIRSLRISIIHGRIYLGKNDLDCSTPQQQARSSSVASLGKGDGLPGLSREGP